MNQRFFDEHEVLRLMEGIENIDKVTAVYTFKRAGLNPAAS